MTRDEILRHALELPEKDRAVLAQRLIRSLDHAGETIDEQDWEQVWAAETKSRADAAHEGTAEPSTARAAADEKHAARHQKRSKRP